MKVTLLGTGDATGTPKIGCSCAQCSFASENKVERLRTSVLIENEGKNLLIDSSPDLRTQLLHSGSPHIDALIWTHGHYDHFMGFGDFYRVQKVPTVYAEKEVMDYCGSIFRFLINKKEIIEPFLPFSLFGLTITLFPVNHPPVPSYGVRIESGTKAIGYTSDTRADIPEDSLRLITGVDLLLVDALNPPGYSVYKHMNYAEALDLTKKLAPADFRCIHMSHQIPWDYPYIGRDGETFNFL